MPSASAASESAENLKKELAAADPRLNGNGAFLAAVLQGSGDCIKILDLEGRLQFMSEGGRRVMEVDDFSQLKGCPWSELWSGEGHAAARRAVEDAVAGKSSSFVGEANTAKGNSRFWEVQVSPIFGDDGRPAHILSISKDVSDVVDARQRLELLNRELQHRLKNTLALVSAIARQTLKGEDIADRREAFTGRLRALSDASDMITMKTLQDAPIHDVVESALRPHLQNRDRVSISGEELHLSAKHALAVALSLHELATNATKYGALSDTNGRIDIRWQLDGKAEKEDEAFQLTWQESDGPRVEAPMTEGFGTKLISRIFAADFSGRVRVDYHPTGLVCTMTAPLPR